MKTLSKYYERRAFIISHLGGRCVTPDCGATEELDTHHVNQAEKSYSINRIWSAAIPRLLCELRKCELRCRNCHRVTPSYGRRPTRAEPPQPSDCPF